MRGRPPTAGRTAADVAEVYVTDALNAASLQAPRARATHARWAAGPLQCIFRPAGVNLSEGAIWARRVAVGQTLWIVDLDDVKMTLIQSMIGPIHTHSHFCIHL